MTRFAATERRELVETARQAGPDAPTLCGEWTVRDLVVHLLVREGGPAAVGIAVPALSGLTERRSQRLAERAFAELVDRVEGGPPTWSPTAVPPLDELANTLEMFVHHEDIRRAQPGWTACPLGAEDESRLWRQVGRFGVALTRKADVGVVLEDVRTGRLRRVHRGTPSVTVRGLPSEVTLHLFGRREQSEVEVIGDPEAVRRLSETSFGL